MYAGAILFRGFHVNKGVEFQDVVQQYNPELSDQYRGTSPRKLVPGTKVDEEGGGKGEGEGRKKDRKWKIHMWQSQVEIECYSVAYFDCITVFEVL